MPDLQKSILGQITPIKQALEDGVIALRFLTDEEAFVPLEGIVTRVMEPHENVIGYDLAVASEPRRAIIHVRLRHPLNTVSLAVAF